MEAEKQGEEHHVPIKRHIYNSYTGLSKRTKFRKISKHSSCIARELRGASSSLTSAVSNFPCNNNYGNNLNLVTSSFKEKDCTSYFSFHSYASDAEFSDTSVYCSDSEELPKESKDLSKTFKEWSIKHNITHSALSELLHIIHNSFPNLPLDSRTLLKTPRFIPTETCEEGSLVYFGLFNNIQIQAKSGLTTSSYPLVKKMQSELGDKQLLTVTLNVDGLPIHSSTTKTFWPILGILDQSLEKNPFVIALFYGESKPSDCNVFLRPLVDECIKLETDGIFLNEIQYIFCISCIIADAPARSFIKCIKSHNSLYGCEKCTQEGTHLGRTTWQYEKHVSLRKDQAFKNHEYEDHHRAKSILAELQVGLVSQIPLDYMHLVCLGVVKRLIRIWLGNGPKKCKLRYSDTEIISERLRGIQKNIPCEFARKPRMLKIFKFWKATEFRLFLLYLGPVVLRGVLPTKLYDHFLILHCAIYILASELCLKSEWRKYADSLLHCFVETSGHLYCKELLIYNFHNLLHLAADAGNFGCLDNFSAFPFESHMSKIKRLIHSPNNPLQQVSKRILECNNFDFSYHDSKYITKYDKNGCIQSIYDKNLCCVVSTSLPNSCFLTVDADIVIVNSIKISSLFEEYNLHCDVFTNKRNFYLLPIKSAQLGIFIANTNEKKSCIISSFKLLKKCLLLPNFQDASSVVCIPYCNMKLCH